MDQKILDKLKSKMRRGDRRIISLRAKCSIYSVDSTLKGKIKGGVSERIILELIGLLEEREKLEAKTESRAKKIVSGK